VWVNGRNVLRERQLTTLDEADLKARADAWRVRILAK